MEATQTGPAPERTGLEYIFVHGLSGWGSYDGQYKKMPYWGMRGGDLMPRLRARGFSCFAASVSPQGSAWDRACELYAQLTGARTDYGKAHSAHFGHERYGRDFSQNPLIPDWDAGKKLVLLGHSFGGATVRLFAELMANGSAEERAGTSAGELSPLFLGGQGSRIHAVIALAAPGNGTTAYDLYEDPDFDVSSIRIRPWDNFWGEVYSRGTGGRPDGLPADDRASFDMHIDNALRLNERISTLPETYYFTVPCSATRAGRKGGQEPDRRLMEPIFRRTSTRMGQYVGKTAGGFPLDASWQENDGLVNVASARAPSGAPSAPFDPTTVAPGIWQVMPPFRGDHMALIGGILKKRDVLPFYLDLLETIDRLPQKTPR